MSQAVALRAQQTWAGPPTSPVCGFWLPELPWVHFCAYGTADGTVVVQQLTVRSGQASAWKHSLLSTIPTYKLCVCARQQARLARRHISFVNRQQSSACPCVAGAFVEAPLLLLPQAARSGEEGQGEREAVPSVQLLLELRTAGGQRTAADASQVAWAEAGGAFLLAASAGGTLAVVSLQRCAPLASSGMLPVPARPMISPRPGIALSKPPQRWHATALLARSLRAQVV